MTAKLRVERLGAEREPVVVVETFSPHPERLVEEAAGLDYAAMGPHYPGVRAHVSPLYFEGLAPVLTPIIRDIFGYRRRMEVDRALYSLVTTPPGALTLAQRIPHFDGVAPGMVAIIHYLSEKDRGGTGFYRHRSTGFETVTEVRHRLYLDALKADFERLGEPGPAYIEGDTPIFERIGIVAPAYNRAVIYRSALLHCGAGLAGHDFSADPRAGRLTVASFLKAW